VHLDEGRRILASANGKPVLLLALLVAFPSISLLLPALMKL
jgi:hypothetical protein